MSTPILNITTNAELSNIYVGMPVAFFFPDMEIYQTARTGKPVKITSASGTVRTGTINQKAFGPLVSLVPQYGPQYPTMVGKSYDPCSMLDDLVDQYPDEANAADGRTFYTVLSVMLDMPPVPTPSMVMPISANTDTVNAIAA